jgi:hypothetical protein
VSSRHGGVALARAKRAIFTPPDDDLVIIVLARRRENDAPVRSRRFDRETYHRRPRVDV